MYLKRKMDATLDAWLSDEDRKPLIVKGPRQVGKTAAMRRFAMEHYESVVEITSLKSRSTSRSHPMAIAWKRW